MKLNVQRWNKNRVSYIHFGYADFFDFDNFALKILGNLKDNTRYSLLLKINFNKDRYTMAGKQIGFKYSGDEDKYVNELASLHNLYRKLVDGTLDHYDVEYVNSIQLLYVLINDIPALKLKNVNKVNFNNNFTNVKDSKERFNFIPLTINMHYFGKSIVDSETCNLLLNKINGQRYLLNQDPLSIDENSKLHVYKINTLIISSLQKDSSYYRGVYDMETGVLINELTDTIVSDNHFIRKIGNVSLTIIDDIVAKVESVKVLSPIKFIPKSLKDEANPFIGSWDVEAFEDIDGFAKVYALGFAVLGKKSQMFYLDDGITSENLVLQCLNSMLVSEYHGYTFYTHNFGRYDSMFLIKILKEENIRLGYEHYITKELDRDGKVLKLNIKIKRQLSDKTFKTKIKREPGYISITIVDSLNILSQSLSALCNSFQVPVVKGHFPYSFVKRDTLHYVGKTPDYRYWENISKEDFKNLEKQDWSLKDECLKYLDRDLVSLVMIMNKFSEYINRKYYLQVTESLTISRLALNIFLKDYLKDSKLPIINKNMFSDIRQAYYGGVTEVYKPYGKNLLHYDVNSLYPFAALNPMPGINCTFIENLGKSLHLKDLFGFFYCEIKTNNGYLGLLPVHSKEGMIMPNGTWKGWYFSEELKYAAEKGYIINVISGYNFNEVNNVFTDYVNDLYQIKSSTNDKVEKDIAKRLLNHLLGRFGLNITKPITNCVNGEELSLLFSTREIIGRPIKITDDDYRVTYNSQIDQDICTDHDLDFIKVQNLTPKTDIENLNEFRDVSLTTAAAVTAYARIYMSKIKQDILDKGGNIYYTDTDSIVTDIPLDNDLIGDGLGKFKLEYKIKQGYYISNKTYYIDLDEPLYDKNTKQYVSSVVKSKAVKNESLSLDSFKSMYNNQNVNAIKRSAVKDHYKGSVLLVDEPVQLRHDAYTKREKLYKRNKWVDTKPLILDGRDNITTTGFKVDPMNTIKLDSFIKKKARKESGVVNVLTIWSERLLGILFAMGVMFSVIGFAVFSSIIYLIVKEDLFDMQNFYNDRLPIDSDLDKILEWKYLDDYMEEPIEVDTCHDNSYFDKFKDFFKKKSGRFYDLFDEYKYINNKSLQDISINFTDESGADTSHYSVANERPQVLSSLLRHQLDIAYNNISILNDKVAASEVLRLRKDVAIHDTISLCKKALTGTPYSGNNSPIVNFVNPLEYSSPILKSHSPIFEQSFTQWSTPRVSSSPFIERITSIGEEYNSVVKNTTPTIKAHSSFVRTGSPLVERIGSPLVERIGSPLVERYEYDIKHNSPINKSRLNIVHGHSLSGDTTVGENFMLESDSSISDTRFLSWDKGISDVNAYFLNSDRSPSYDISPINVHKHFPPKEEGLLIDTFNGIDKGKHLIMDNKGMAVNDERYISARKYPIRTAESPSIIKRYGNIWPTNFDPESPSTIKRYGWLSPAGTSVLEDHSPLNKRFGHIFSEEFKLKKDYHVITEHNNIYKAYSPNID